MVNLYKLYFIQKSNHNSIMTDSDTFIEKKKLPLKSISGENCLTECHKKGEWYLNPVTLDPIINYTNSSCAIIPIPKGDSFYKWSTCRFEDNAIYHAPSEKDSMLLTFHFDPYEFLTEI